MPRPLRIRSRLPLLAFVVLGMLAIGAGWVTPSSAAGVAYKLDRVYAGASYGFGNSLAANARHVVVGSPFEDATNGAVYVFDRATGALRARLTSPAPGFFFGWSVALDGDVVVVGEQGGGLVIDFFESGAVHLFAADTGALLRTLPTVHPRWNGGLGTAVAAGGGMVVASAPFLPFGFSSRYGVVLVYDTATGALVRTIMDPDGAGYGFGTAVALGDDEIVVGKSDGDAGGTVFRFDRTTFELLGTLHHPDPEALRFGEALAIDGSRLVVGGGEAALVFDLPSGTLLRTLPKPFPDGERFATSVAVSPTGVLVAQPPIAATFPIRQIGAALLYEPDSSALRALITEPDPSVAFDRIFARRVLLDGDHVLLTAGDGDATEVREYRPACGDGAIDACERCDDGNRTAGDGCDADCRLESCGDGVVGTGEDCDDGNAIDGDGCDTTCTASGCGNCVVAGTEACDDGNTTTGDGCDANCTFAACRNGEVGPFETCDDANAIGGDGCSPVCKAEVCGDWTVDAGESCDDGNRADGDGCDAMCRLETTKLDWWQRAYGVFAGDFNPYYGRRQATITDRHLLVLAHVEETQAFAYDRETGAEVHLFPDMSAGPLEATPDGILIGEDENASAVIHLYDPDTFTLRQSFHDPTPATVPSFGRYVGLIDGTVLVQDGADHGVHLFDAATGAFERTLFEPAMPNAPSPIDPIRFGLVMAPFHGGALLSGTHAAYLFDLATGVLLRTFTGPRGAPVLGSQAVPFGDDLLLPAAGGAVHLVDGATGAVRHTFLPPGTAENADDWRTTVAGTDVLLANPTLGIVHVYDGASFTLRHTIRDPEHRENSCFGAPLALTDLGLAVSDPCDGDDLTGIVYLFERATGEHIATIGNPNGDYLDFFATRGGFGSTLLTWYQAGDSGVVNAWRPTSDGTLTPGEECDDGNLVNGDGCDVNGTVTRCGNGFRTAGEHCDDGNRVAGDGCELDCTPTRLACAEPGGLERVRLTLRGIGGAADTGRLTLAGHLPAVDPHLAASLVGAEVRVEDATGAPVFELSTRTTPIPPGLRGSGCGRGDGWRDDRTREIYVNKSGALPPACAPASAGGLERLVLTRAAAGGRALQLRVRGAAFTTVTSPLRVVVALGAEPGAGGAERCGGHTFATLDCRWNRRGTALVCR